MMNSRFLLIVVFAVAIGLNGTLAVTVYRVFEDLTAGPRTNSLPLADDTNYIPSLNAQYVFTAAPNSRIMLTFSTFDIQNECDKDHVTYGNGKTPGQNLIATVCGTTIPNMFISSGNEIWVAFVSDATVQAKGATFMAQEIAGCGGELTVSDMMQNISSPTINGKYPPMLECTWFIKPRTGEKFTLEFFSFMLETSTTCAKDYVKVGYGRDVTLKEIFKKCGEDKPALLTSEEAIYVQFKSDAAVDAVGFVAGIKAGAAQLSMASTGLIALLIAGNQLLTAPAFI